MVYPMHQVAAGRVVEDWQPFASVWVWHPSKVEDVVPPIPKNGAICVIEKPIRWEQMVTWTVWVHREIFSQFTSISDVFM
jgi:hypothetical protein